jgi:hypothetical protein
MQQHITTLNHQPDSFGTLLKQWRDRRNFSQLDLAFTSQVSQRHISMILRSRNCELNVYFPQMRQPSDIGNSPKIAIVMQESEHRYSKL